MAFLSSQLKYFSYLLSGYITRFVPYCSFCDPN